MKKFLVIASLLLASYSLYALDQEEKAKKSDNIVVIETDFGEIQIGLFRDAAPLNVDNIVKLVKRDFYNGTTFHRVIPDFVIQGGDPLTKDKNPSNDGTGGPGYYVKDEYSKDLKHLIGTVALAKAVDDRNGSQFYICLKTLNFLDGKYTIVGQVIKGMDVVKEIAKVKTGKNDRPIENVTMKIVYMKEKEANKTKTADRTKTEEPKETEYSSKGQIDVDMYIPRTEKSNPKDIAVVVGIRDYSNPNIPDVDYALNDASIMKEYLKNILGYSEENIIYLENPSKGELETVFGTHSNPKGKLYNYVRPGESNIFVYYSGHGAPDIDEKKAYLVPYDGDPSYISVNGFPLNILFENISAIPARGKTIVIDACFSGNTPKGMLMKGVSPLTVIPVISKGYEGLNVITAGKEGEVAGWYSEKHHGIFTYFFLKGIRGEADVNNDRVLTLGELADYLEENVPYYSRRLHGIEQHPVFTGKREEVIVKW